MRTIRATKPFGPFSQFKIELCVGRFGMTALGFNAEVIDEVTGGPACVVQVDSSLGEGDDGPALMTECRRRIEASPAWAESNAQLNTLWE